MIAGEEGEAEGRVGVSVRTYIYSPFETRVLLEIGLPRPDGEGDGWRWIGREEYEGRKRGKEV